MTLNGQASLTLHSPITTMSMTSKNFAKPMGQGGANKDSGNYTNDTFKVLLKKLVQSPTEFTADDCATAFRHLCVQAASDAQVRDDQERKVSMNALTFLRPERSSLP